MSLLRKGVTKRYGQNNISYKYIHNQTNVYTIKLYQQTDVKETVVLQINGVEISFKGIYQHTEVIKTRISNRID